MTFLCWEDVHVLIDLEHSSTAQSFFYYLQRWSVRHVSCVLFMPEIKISLEKKHLRKFRKKYLYLKC